MVCRRGFTKSSRGCLLANLACYESQSWHFYEYMLGGKTRRTSSTLCPHGGAGLPVPIPAEVLHLTALCMRLASITKHTNIELLPVIMDSAHYADYTRQTPSSIPVTSQTTQPIPFQRKVLHGQGRRKSTVLQPSTSSPILSLHQTGPCATPTILRVTSPT